MNKYILNKEKTRSDAIDFQNNFCNNNISYNELFNFQQDFTKRAKKYGLIKEFKENGII